MGVLIRPPHPLLISFPTLAARYHFLRISQSHPATIGECAARRGASPLSKPLPLSSQEEP